MRLIVRRVRDLNKQAAAGQDLAGRIGEPAQCRINPDAAKFSPAAMCGSAKNSSRSRTDNLLSAMAKSLRTATDKLARCWSGGE